MNYKNINEVKTFSRLWSPTGPIGIEVNGEVYKGKEGENYYKYLASMSAANYINNTVNNTKNDFDDIFTEENLKEIYLKVEGKENICNNRTNKYQYGNYERGFYKGMEIMFKLLNNKNE